MSQSLVTAEAPAGLTSPHHGRDVGGESCPPAGSLQEDGEQAGDPARHQGSRPVVGPAQQLSGSC